MSIALVTVQAVGTGVVVIVVAVAVVLLVLPGGRVDPWQQNVRSRGVTRLGATLMKLTSGPAARSAIAIFAQEHAERPIDPDR